MWKKKLYIKNNPEPYPLNRTKLELFKDCRRCFYLDVIKGIRRPHGPPQVISNAIIQIIKNEYNQFREKKIQHPQIKEINHDISIASHVDLDKWRNPFKGIQFIHKPSNFRLSGTINDLWYNDKKKKYITVDYKSTAKKDDLTYDSIWDGYWRQLSFYKYLLEKKEMEVDSQGYIIFSNVKRDSIKFEENIKFKTQVFSKRLDLSWIEELIYNAFNVLQFDNPPPPSGNCKFCEYVNFVNLFK